MIIYTYLFCIERNGVEAGRVITRGSFFKKLFLKFFLLKCEKPQHAGLLTGNIHEMSKQGATDGGEKAEMADAVSRVEDSRSAVQGQSLGLRARPAR